MFITKKCRNLIDKPIIKFHEEIKEKKVEEIAKPKKIVKATKAKLNEELPKNNEEEKVKEYESN